MFNTMFNVLCLILENTNSMFNTRKAVAVTQRDGAERKELRWFYSKDLIPLMILGPLSLASPVHQHLLPLDAVLLTVVLILCRSHHHGWDAEDRSQSPDANIDHLGLVGCADVQGFDGVADGNVAVHTHHGQREGAGEHVVVVDGDGNLAQDISKGPEAQECVCSLEGQGHQAQGVSQSEVKDVNVGSCLHLGESETQEWAMVTAPRDRDGSDTELYWRRFCCFQKEMLYFLT